MKWTNAYRTGNTEINLPYSLRNQQILEAWEFFEEAERSTGTDNSKYEY